MENIKELLGSEINIVLDKENKPWFDATQIATILNYSKQRQAINQIVDNKYIEKLQNIVLNYKIYKNAQPHTIFINEFGLYTFLLKSNNDEAKPYFNKILKLIIS